jgi:hypothetical protein
MGEERASMDDRTASRRANDVSEEIGDLERLRVFLVDEGWRVTAQQVANTINLLHDVERRLRNGDDWRG